MSTLVDQYGVGGSADPGTLAFVQIHASGGGSTAWSAARATFYGWTGTPMNMWDGWDEDYGGYGDYAQDYARYHGSYLSHVDDPTDVTIELTGNEVSGSTYSVEAKVCIESGGTGKTMRIYVVQVLDHWPFTHAYHRNGFKQAADTHGSEPDITLADDECQTIVKEFTFDADSWANQDDIKIIAWAQEPLGSGPADVYQAAVMVWPFPPSNALIIDLPNGVPEYILPAEPTDISVQIEDASETYVPDSGLLHYRYDGGEYLTSPLTPQSRALYWATLPAPECDDIPEFYISALGDEGTTVYSPKDAPASVYTTSVGTVNMILDDDFDGDQGWTVENDPSLTSGAWERAIPGIDVHRGAPPEDYDDDGSGYCYVTDNDSLGDVDGGPTMLISPTRDLSGRTDPILRFAYWWKNDDQDGDPMDIDISNDDGATWIPVLTFADLPLPPEWHYQVINIADAIDPEPLTSQMKVRISVVDLGPDASIDEGAIDAVEIFDVVCGETFPPGDIDEDGDVDLDDHAIFVDCLAGPDVTDPPPGCGAGDFARADLDPDGDVDLEDVGVFFTILPQ